MVTTAENICNLAISHVGSSAEIALLTEKSAEARACNRFYEVARDKVLRDFPWPFSTKTVTLALVSTNPTTEWLYSYRYPSDCLYMRRLLSIQGTNTGMIPLLTRRDNVDSQVKYQICKDSQGELIYTDLANAQAEYTERVVDPTRYPSDFVMALSFLLAHYLAPRLSKGNAAQLDARNSQSYELELSRARAAAGNEERPDRWPEAETIRARNE